MNSAAPPIIKLTTTLLRDIEQAVVQFPRHHRHVIGADLRRQVMEVARLADRAWRDRARTADWVSQLVWAVDELRLTLQLCKEVQAFSSFSHFEHFARAVDQLGRQVGGWNKQQHPQGQSGSAQAPAQRATTLSTRAASNREANP